ncbi:pyridoxamine 5'-phosphate oxidase family protein [Aquimarina addita]|uniref:Pyridoxamine 5'-phosphate oxidase family protein n=1 Tax=Aquimarina addita TaxID=870485 RepID=A0ABP6UJ77_9FLAO
MSDIIFSSIVVDLKNALENKEHPFRYFTLATSDINYSPRLRTVVLRNVDKDLTLMIYTDHRSKKVTHILEHEVVSLLFYDPERLLQITMRAKATIVTDPHTLKTMWSQVPVGSRKSYTSELAPGQEIKDPDEIDYLDERHFFSAIQIIPERIEYLRLKRPNHIRVLFKKNKNNWKGNFIAP